MAQGDPIPGVDISIEQSPGGIVVATTTTGADGGFAFHGLPAGTYRVVVSPAGVERSLAATRREARNRGEGGRDD